MVVLEVGASLVTWLRGAMGMGTKRRGCSKAGLPCMRKGKRLRSTEGRELESEAETLRRKGRSLGNSGPSGLTVVPWEDLAGGCLMEGTC